MKIGIIGAGNIGGTLARRLAALGHQVSVANSRGPESLAAFGRETGARPVTVEEAARAGDVVIISIPLKNIARLPRNLFQGVPDSVVVVDTGNYYPRQRDGRIDPIERGTTETRWVADRLGRSVVKAFNNIYARHLQERGKPRASQVGSRFRSRGTIPAPRRSSPDCWTSWGSMRSMAADWTIPGGSSPERRSTGPTSTRRGCAAGWRRQAGAARRVPGHGGGGQRMSQAPTARRRRSTPGQSGRPASR